MAKLPDYPGVSSMTDRHGKERWRYRKTGHKDVRLPGEPHSREFDVKYQSIIEGKSIKKSARPYRENPRGIRGTFPQRIENMLFQLKRRAVSLHRPYELDEEWLIAELERQDYRCAVTGIPFQAERIDGKRVNPFAPSIDRIDCSGGYTKDNIRLVLTSVNLALSDFGLDHFDMIVAARVQQIVKDRIAA